MTSHSMCNYRFSSDASWFIDYAEAARACPQSKLTTHPNLGLLDQIYGSDDKSPGESRGWAGLARHVQDLNDKNYPGVVYKILLVVRHGRGVHNVVMDEVGSAEWKKYWGKIEGDGNRTWFDADLVDEGREQAKALGTFFAEGVTDKGFPVPDTVYTSPLSRCLETSKLVFKDVMERHGQAFRPKVRELLRERLTAHTCDRRRSREWIIATYPDYEIEAGLADEDGLWQADRLESTAEHVARTQRLLEGIWRDDSGASIALVTHSFALSSILEAIGAPGFLVSESVMTAFLVKGEKLGGNQAP